jgi:PhnB protein
LAQEDAMSIKNVNPYLSFSGTAEKAIKLYEGALGAKVENVMRYGDAKGMDVPADSKNRIMHAVLKVGSAGAFYMLSDTTPDMPAPAGNNVRVSLDWDDAAEMAKSFDALSVGGKVTMPLQDTFWGAKFGMLTDAFGIHWMFNCENRK